MGPVSFLVKLIDGRDRRCHLEQLHKRTVDTVDHDVSQSSFEIPVPDVVLPDIPESSEADTSPVISDSVETSSTVAGPNEIPDTVITLDQNSSVRTSLSNSVGRS